MAWEQEARQIVIDSTEDTFKENKRHLSSIVMIREVTDSLIPKLDDLKETENGNEERRSTNNREKGIFGGFNPADEQPARSAY